MKKDTADTGYDTFTALLADRLQKKFGGGCRFIPHEGIKTNGGMVHSITVQNSWSNISPSIHMDDFYLDYKAGRTGLDDIAEMFFQLYDQNKAAGSMDTDMLTDWNQARGSVRCRIINTGMNAGLLAGMPHREILDLSVAYYLDVEMPDGAAGTMHICNKHLELWGADEETLYGEAWKNMRGDVCIDRLEDIISAYFYMPGPDDIDMLNSRVHILTNKRKLFGAVCMASRKTMAEAARKIGSDLWILPSSVHEVILLPADEGCSVEGLAQIVCEVNRSELSEDEILSCHVYHYSRNTKKISIAV